MSAGRARLQKSIRIALVLQAVGLLAIIALTFPDWLDGYLRPYAPCGLCFDLRGLFFALTAISFGPAALVLLLMAWRWRGPRLWPLAIVALIDAVAIWLTAGVVVSFVGKPSEWDPLYASLPPFLLLPALVTLALCINLLRPLPWKPIVAASSAGSVLLAAFLWVFTIQPVRQSVPGELSLPFSKTAAYESRGLGCLNYVQGWIDAHECTRATLLVYHGTGDLSKDEATIQQALSHQLQSVPPGALVEALPVDVGVGHTDDSRVDSSNRGLCLIIADRATHPPSNLPAWRCGLATDYADIRSQWPANDRYAIGIIYYFNHRDYISDHSVNFLDASHYSVQPGHAFTLPVLADPNTRCSIAAYDASGAELSGLQDKTTDAEGNVKWTWLVEAGTTPGRWPIAVSCGSSIGRTHWSVI